MNLDFFIFHLLRVKIISKSILLSCCFCGEAYTASFEHLYKADFNLRSVRKISLDKDLTINGVFDGSGRSYIRELVALHSRLKDKDLQDKPLMYGGIALQPFAFLVGHIISNKSALRKFEWNKTKELWYEIDESEFENQIIFADNTIDQGTELNIVIASSEDPISRENDLYFNTNGIAVFQLKQNKYDSLHSGKLQKILVSNIIDFVKRKRRKRKIDLVKFSFACQNSFPLELGRYWTLSELPSVEVLNFNIAKMEHEWSIKIEIGNEPMFIDRR